MAWHDLFVAWDTETTGFGPEARILEIGVVVFENLEPVHRWSSLICPERVDLTDPGIKKALEINKIAAADLRGKPTFADVFPQVCLELGDIPVWAAHNSVFDSQMLRQEMTRLGDCYKWPKPAMFTACTMSIAAKLDGQKKGHKLFEIAEKYDVKMNYAHRADVDAETCGRILSAMLRRKHVPEEDAAMKALCAKAEAEWQGRFKR
jgi:DNA polymerase-3 subunit epsilon